MPERSFFIKGYQLPLCARCTGILVGELVAFPMWIVCRPSVILSLFLIVPMACDGLLQYGLYIMSNNGRRFVTGLFAGYGLTTLYIYLFQIITRWATNGA